MFTVFCESVRYRALERGLVGEKCVLGLRGKTNFCFSVHFGGKYNAVTYSQRIK